MLFIATCSSTPTGAAKDAVLISIGIPIIKVGRFHDHMLFIMGILI